MAKNIFRIAQPQLSMVLRGAIHFADWHLDAYRRTGLGGIPVYPFGILARHGVRAQFPAAFHLRRLCRIVGGSHSKDAHLYLEHLVFHVVLRVARDHVVLWAGSYRLPDGVFGIVGTVNRI